MTESDSWLKGLMIGAGVGAGAVLLFKQLTQDNGTGETGQIGATIGSLQGTGGEAMPIYLDWNATTPIFPEVKAAMDPFTFQYFGNPSSDSRFSAHCGAAVKQARTSVAAMLHCETSEVVFTSCGTESDNTAIYLAIEAASVAGTVPHVVTTNIEHPAVEQYLAALEQSHKVAVTRIAVGKDGVVSAAAVMTAVRASTVLVTVMHSNNEIGSINPIATIAAACRAKGVLCHTDAAQSCGKVKIDVALLGVDMLTCVGHKFGAPKGIACLFIRKDCLSDTGRLPPAKYGESGALFVGGGQEAGRRAGTENVLQIAALGEACAIVTAELDKTHAHMAALRERLLQKLTASQSSKAGRIPASIVNGPADPKSRLPNTLSISFEGIDSGRLLADVRDQVSASAGSACHTGGGVSAVLQAIEVPEAFIKGTLRLSVGRHTTERDVDRAADIIGRCASKWAAQTQRA